MLQPCTLFHFFFYTAIHKLWINNQRHYLNMPRYWQDRSIYLADKIIFGFRERRCSNWFCVIIGFPFGMLIWPKKPGAAWVSFSLFQISCGLAQRHLAHTIPMSYKGMQEKCIKWANLHFFNRNLFIYFSFFLFFISPGVTSCTATVNLLLSGCSSDLRFRSEMYIVGLSYSRHVGNICEGFFFK